MRKVPLKCVFLFLIAIASCLLVAFSSSQVLPSTASLSKQLNPTTARAVCAAQPNNNGCPRAAYIWQVIGGAVERVVYYRSGIEPIVNPRGRILHDEYRLRIAGDISLGTLLRFTSQRNQPQNFLIPGYLASAGFHPSTTVYKYPCTIVGSFTIGWEGQRSSTCDGGEVFYNPALREAEDYTRRNAGNVGPRPRSQKEQNSELNVSKQSGTGSPSNQGGASVNLQLYCSVAATSGSAWQVELANRAEADLDTICNRAIEKCEIKAGNDCFIVRQGYWRTYHPNLFLRRVRLRFQCETAEPYYDAMLEGIKVEEEWKSLEERAINASSCVLSVYNPDDILIAPDSTQRTLMHTDDNSERLRITALVGKLVISQPGDPSQIGIQPGDPSHGQSIELSAGEQLILLKTTGQSTEKNLNNTERRGIIQLPVVQEFLRVENWELLSDEDPVRQQIQAFRDAVTNQFWQPPATSVEVINGVWRATITLRPDIGLRLVADPSPSIMNAASLRNFAAANNNPDLILGGLFRESRHSFLASNCMSLRSEQGYATILGLTRDNRPEMISRGGLDGRQPAFDQYCFAITGGPRLLRANDPSYRVTPEAARAQGHRDPNFTTARGINSRSARSAICISRDQSSLYYIATPNGVSLSLPEFANILRSDSIGCGDAMNLEGGTRQVLYFPQGERAPGLLPTGEAPPYWVLVYENYSSLLPQNAFFAIVSSPQTAEEAQAIANEIRQNNPDLDVSWFTPFENSEYHSVAVAARTSLERAETACRIAKDREIAPDPFIWAFPGTIGDKAYFRQC